MGTTDSPLAQAVFRFAAATYAFTDADLEQPWAWRAHDEGVRFAFLGSYHELRDLAARLAARRAGSAPPVSRAHRALGQYLAAYRDLQALLIGVGDEDYERQPAPSEWPLRTILGHTAGAQRHFFTLVHYGLARQRQGGDWPTRLPADETEKVTGPYADFRTIMNDQPMAEMVAFYDTLHRRAMAEFAGMTDEELDGLSMWWEGEDYSLQYRLHRFDAHLRQHTIQVEKTLEMIGRGPNEARRLLRLIYQALAEVEAAVLGAPGLGAAEQEQLAAAIVGRAGEVAAVVAQAREVIAAIKDDNLARAREAVAANPKMANARSQSGLPAVILAVYYGRRDIATALVEAGAELGIHEATAYGDLAVVQKAAGEWPGWVNEYARDGFTPLQLACFFGHPEIALWLMEQAADVNAVARNKQRIRPIHAAAASGDLNVLKALLERGAEVNARQEGDFTALHEAANSGNLALARLLVEHGADLLVETAEGYSPLDLAVARNQTAVADWLRDQGG